MSNTIDCPICHGVGALKVFSNICPIIKCHFCDGHKKVHKIYLEWMTQGKILKQKRLEKQLTLKKAAKLFGLHVSLLSDMEIGKIEPDMDLINNI